MADAPEFRRNVKANAYMQECRQDDRHYLARFSQIVTEGNDCAPPNNPPTQWPLFRLLLIPWLAPSGQHGRP